MSSMSFWAATIWLPCTVSALPALLWARERYERETEAYKKGPDFFLYLIGDELVDSYFPLLDCLETEIDDLEERIGTGSGSAVMRCIFALKQELIHLAQGHRAPARGF